MGDDTSNDPSGDEAESTEAGSSQYPDEPIEAPGEIRVRRVIAVGGGRGGVGKSLVAGNLAVYFAQLGKSVVLVDGDATGGNLHAHFGVAASSAPEPDDLAALTQSLVATSIPGLSILPAPHDAVEPPLALRAGRKLRWLGRLRALPAEYLIIDVGPGHGAFALDIMAAADVALCVTVPEPPAIETTYRYLRASFRRHLRKSIVRDRFRVHLLDRALRELGRLPSPLDLVRALSKIDRALGEIAWSEANRLRHALVVNQTRVRTDLELGAWMSGLTWRHYGLRLDEIGHIEHDDTVWLTVRRNKPLLVDAPTSKAARNIERIARRVLALGTLRGDRASAPPALPLDPPTHYTVLGITRSANDEEARRAYKRQREVYSAGGLATSSLLTDTQLKSEQGRLDEAYDTLLDPIRRRAYDLSTFPEQDEPAAVGARAVRPALAAEQIMLQGELAREIGPDTDFTGALLRKVRESQGIELGEIVARTKIGRTHLAALEEERFGDLPAVVYVRGFLSEVAKFLRLDPAQVQKTYLRRMRAATESGKGAD
ncbi:MAG: helix-turn-helix domain-containing protein [Polyangiaceae bacterium]